MASHGDCKFCYDDPCLALQEKTVYVLHHPYLVAKNLLKREKGIHSPREDDVALQTIYNKDLRTYVIQYVARAMHKVGNGCVELPVICVLINIGQKYPDIQGVYRGVTFRAGFSQLPTLEQLFIDAEMAVRAIRTEYNHKTDCYGLAPAFPSDFTIGAFERGYEEKKYGALFAAGYKDHLVHRGMYESPAYQIFLKHQDWRKKFGPSGEGNKENRKISVRSQNQV
jgi:hypothetical protein